ncbi:MAG: chemotaxis protein CheX [Dehalococcoidia bacterium]
MKEEYVNAFLTPARTVWEKELGQSLEFVKAEAVSHQFTTEDIAAVIGVSGKLDGTVVYGFPLGTAKAIVSSMVGEEEANVRDEIGLSALGEIANMITGNAATALAQIGYGCNISPPVIVEPAGARFTTMSGPQIMVTFNSVLGIFTVRVGLYESHRDE